MEIRHITPQQHSNFIKAKENKQGNNQNPSFGSAAFASSFMAAPNVFLRFLDTNQAWGANLVDVGSMVIPRTAYDMKNRGLATGLETGRRESTGTFNHAMVGVYGTVAGALLAMGLNNAYKFKAHKIFANNDTLNILGDKWYNALHSGSNDPLKSYLQDVTSNMKLYNPARKDAVEGFVSMSEDTQKLVVNKFYDLIKNGSKDTIKSDDVNYLKALITSDTGAEKSVLLKGFHDGKLAQADNVLATLLENIHNVTKAFEKPKVIESFKNAAKASEASVLKSLKSLNVSRAVAGLGFAALFGMSVQPVNMYLTKKKTGCDGFPGVPGRKKDNSNKFFAMKSAMAVLFGAGAISTIMVGDKKSAIKEAAKMSDKLKDFGGRFLSKIQFKGMMPTINQLKFVYGMTIFSRLMCARDKDELRESAVKDSLGFLNLLIIGGLVTKGVTRLMNKDLIVMPKNAGEGFASWMKNSSVKSRDEVILETLKKYGIDVVKDGKALPYGKLLEAMKGLPSEAKSALKGKLAVLNIAQLIGYAYSGIFLGHYLPKINDKMSKANEEKRIAKQAKAEGKTVEQVKAEIAAEQKKMEEKMSGKKVDSAAKAEKTQPAHNTVSTASRVTESPKTEPQQNATAQSQLDTFKAKHLSA